MEGKIRFSKVIDDKFSLLTEIQKYFPLSSQKQTSIGFVNQRI